MQLHINQKMINQRNKIGQYVSFAGLAVLIIGLVLTFRVRPGSPNYNTYMGVALVTLLLGFIAAQIGNYNLRRFGKGRAGQRPDESLAAALKGFDDRFELYAWQLPVPYVLLSPFGLYVFSIREEKGKMIVNGDKWKQPFNFTRLLHVFGQEGVGNPGQEATASAEKLNRFIAKQLPDLDITPHPLVFFSNSQVNIQQNNPTVPIVIGKELKKFLRRQPSEMQLSESVRQQLSALFSSEE